MFTLDELHNKVADCRDGRLALDDFEDWFSEESRGANGDQELRGPYFAVEDAISQIRFRDFGPHAVFVELAIRLQMASQFGSNTAGNGFDGPSFLYTTGTNATRGFILVKA